jgi:2-(3-amino-3-carboxypropyl)histidine synthase
MKTLFIPAKYNKKIAINEKHIKQLPKRICLVSSVQFVDSLKDIKKILEKDNKKVSLIKGKHSIYEGQILGCDIPEIKNIDAFLFIGDGLFHPIGIQMKNNVDVFCYNPLAKDFFKLNKEESEKMKKRIKVNLTKFYHAENIGLLISTKPGQFNLLKAKKFETKFPDKKFYYLIFDTLDFNEFENFSFIDCFVNTACPRIGMDDLNKISKPVINIEDIE